MVILARLAGLTMIEVPVTYRPRRGESKITGSFSTSMRVAVNMIRIIVRYRVRRPATPEPRRLARSPRGYDVVGADPVDARYPLQRAFEQGEGAQESGGGEVRNEGHPP